MKDGTRVFNAGVITGLAIGVVVGVALIKYTQLDSAKSDFKQCEEDLTGRLERCVDVEIGPHKKGLVSCVVVR